MASDGARSQVRRPDHRVAPLPGRALNHRRHQNRNHSRQLVLRFRLRTRRCWLSLFSFLNLRIIFARPQALARSHSLHTRQVHTH
ncbi:hypothetical protein AHAS_Ahas09G0070200 [Arachis hypogaea]